MSKEFLDTSTLDDALSIINKSVSSVTSAELVHLTAAAGRVTSKDLLSPEDLPAFPKSTVDGFAVKSASTFGASEATPIYLEVTGEVEMGTGEVINKHGSHAHASYGATAIIENTAIRIPTGGMLPKGADASVMIEFTHACGKDDQSGTYMIEVTRPVSPGENVIQVGEDLKDGDIVFSKGHRIRPQDIGILAGLGITRIHVFSRPKVAIISTGPEICPIDQKPGTGQARDINAYTLAALAQESGAESIYMGICPDDLEQIKNVVKTALSKADCALISGGSSVGTRDFTYQAISDLGPPGVLVHGLSISPGKPTIIGQSETKIIIGLPGHPSSSMVVAQAIVLPTICRLAGISLSSPLERQLNISSRNVKARLTRNIPSQPGKDTFVRMAISTNAEKRGGLLATPVFGKSGLISTFIRSHGLLKIPAGSEGAYEGDEVDIQLF
ncbi:molybdopterin molybdotransferase MoeA [bacterium]|nr:molybdopterin molybdotransferase MoeA [bacterium]